MVDGHEQPSVGPAALDEPAGFRLRPHALDRTRPVQVHDRASGGLWPGAREHPLYGLAPDQRHAVGVHRSAARGRVLVKRGRRLQR
jgi:hypothetical protein